MPRILPALFLLFTVIQGLAQCSYPASISTNKDYCVGSSLIVNSTHALQRIVWYKNGQRIDSVFCNQSLANTYTALHIPGVWPTADLIADGDGNLYTVDGPRRRIVRWNPATGSVATIGFLPINTIIGSLTWLFVDHEGNLYIWLSDAVYKYSPGSTTPTSLPTGLTASSIDDEFGIYVDCQQNLYISGNGRIDKWAPGASSGITVAGGNGVGSAPDQLGNEYRMQIDSLGNIFMLWYNLMTVWPAGARVEQYRRMSASQTPAEPLISGWMAGIPAILSERVKPWMQMRILPNGRRV